MAILPMLLYMACLPLAKLSSQAIAQHVKTRLAAIKAQPEPGLAPTSGADVLPDLQQHGTLASPTEMHADLKVNDVYWVSFSITMIRSNTDGLSALSQDEFDKQLLQSQLKLLQKIQPSVSVKVSHSML